MYISKLTEKKGGVFAIGLVAGLASGAIAGYIFGTKKKDVEQDDPTQLTIFDVAADDSPKVETPHFEVVPDVIDKVEEERNPVDYSKSAQVKHKPIFTPIEHSSKSVQEAPLVNIFSARTGVWDYEKEVAARSSNFPYVIHQDEFVSDEMGYKQETVTYYAADDILADENDTPMYNYASILGPLKFGHGSNDKNVVYIRNEGYRMEYEVLLHTGSFAYEVLGQELGEEDKIPVRKFRQE